ncbi:response regulator transcription factor [Myxococcota bacterium]|nr:response regulator transcription factor [Myxococcota bacterium]
MSHRILVVDDEPDLLELIRVTLTHAGFEVETATQGSEALTALGRCCPDLMVLDLMLPDVSGIEICRKVRSAQEWADLPIIMVTARSQEFERVIGFEMGADDYVVKPFSPRELVLRVRAVLRRMEAPAEAPHEIRRGALWLDLEGHRCTVGELPVELTAKEFRLLSALITRPGRVLSRDRLLDEVWGRELNVTARTIDSHMRRLREKLGESGKLIETVRGVGYRLSAH